MESNQQVNNIKTLLILLALASTTANAASLKGGYWACVSEDLFDQIGMAAVKKDKNAVKYLIKNGCFGPKAGISISILDTSWGTAKVRAYVGNQAIVLWTNTENINR